ncbi:nitroreductase [Clostridium baratii]|uniref:nitroreductase family protein n=1 Tax=Clostridium baratii TaxID=1561 RepID=UPI0006C47B4E|nr:nitroreductase family protein [Clostridium baratii]CUP33257.1 nitroreductase [Clostridium baratii]
MEKDFYEILKNRRSYYGIGKDSKISDERIEEVINAAVKYTPSAFNSQSANVVILFGENHDKLWDITKETLRKIVPENSFSSTENKINSFKNGHGTILFFEDTNITKSLQSQFELYKDNFPVWAEQSNGMLQYVIWTSLEHEGLGVSLQHYNPLIDEEVKKTFNIPDEWKLIAEMPFGNPTAEPGEKSFRPLEERVKVFK